jgi:cysteine desulfurase / selenocysteine lyase
MDWEVFRAEFPVTRRWAFLNHAAVSPLPMRGQRALETWAKDMADNGIANEPQWRRRIEQVRGLAGRLLNAEPSDIAFIKNTSEGIGIVAEGFRWEPGDNVVTAAEEFPSNIYPWLNLADRGVELRIVPLRDGRVDIDDLRNALDGQTRIVTLSSVEYSTGFRNDLNLVGELCRERGILFFVDGIQSLGVFPLDVQKAPVDFVSADGHKWLLSPEGAGLFWIRRELVERLHPVGIGWNSVVNSLDFATLHFQLKPHAGRWESGAMNVAGIHALGESLALLLDAGIPAVAERVLEITDYLCAKAESGGMQIHSSRREGEKSGIVSLTVPGHDAHALVRRAKDAGILITTRSGCLRISPHAYNTRAEIDHLLDVLRA